MNRIIAHIRHSLEGIYPDREVHALAMLIGCDMLGLSAVDLYAGKDTTLSESKQRELENILLRLQKNEPIQYIRGVAEFAGETFCVEKGVLIPRPETAELVEHVLHGSPHARRILDIGTGSGCIAITLSLRLPEAQVEAWDISEKALSVARKNNERLRAQVTFRRCDVRAEEAEKGGRFDVIVSNPPYVTEKEKATMDANVLEWEPAEALFVPDDDPLLFYRRIAELGQRRLAADGKLFLEINRAYGLQTAQLLTTQGYRHVQVIKDIFGNDRIIIANR